jgi:hypothetical protein
MNALGKLIRIFVVCGAILSACGGEAADSTGCGSGIKWEYLINGYSANLVRYEKSVEFFTMQTPIPLVNNESPGWNTFGLEVKAVYQRYQAKVLPKPQFSLFARAMACSPAIVGGKQKVTNISITSANDFNDTHLAGSELVSLFGAIGYVSKLTTMLVGAPAPLELHLKLLETPQYARQSFDVEITLDDGSVFLMKTGDVYFKLP